MTIEMEREIVLKCPRCGLDIHFKYTNSSDAIRLSDIPLDFECPFCTTSLKLILKLKEVNEHDQV